MLRQLRQVLHELRGEPGGQRGHAGEAGRLAQAEVIGHHAALAEAGEDDPLRLDRIPHHGLADEVAQEIRSVPEGLDVGRLPHAEREPAIAVLAAAERHGHGTLRTEDKSPATVKHGREPEKVVGAGPPAMEGDDGRKGSISRRDVGCVQQAHGGEDIAETHLGPGTSVGVAKESLESRLLEVTVVSERLRDAVPDHDPYGGAIRQSPGLVAPLRIKRKSVLELQAGLGDDGDVGILAKALDQEDRSGAQNLTTTAVVVQQLHKYHLTGHNSGATKRFGKELRLSVERVSRVQESDPVARIGEDRPHSSSLGAP